MENKISLFEKLKKISLPLKFLNFKSRKNAKNSKINVGRDNSEIANTGTIIAEGHL